MKFIHTGDVHIGNKFKSLNLDNGYGRFRREEVVNSFFTIIDRVKEEKIDLLFISGDLFDSEYCSISIAKHINSKFKEIEDCKIIIVGGNHDPLVRESIYNLMEWNKNVFIFKNKVVDKIYFQELNTYVWGASFEEKYHYESLVSDTNIEDESAINILIIHGDITSNSKYNPIDKEILLKSKFDYIALGHIHKHEFISDKIAYCGSPEPLGFGEEGDHGIIQGEFSKGDKLIEFIPLSKRKYIIRNITLNPNMSYLDVQTKIKLIDDLTNRQSNFYRIILEGFVDRDIVIDIEKLFYELKEEFYYIEIINKSEKDFDIEALEEENKGNIIGLFIKEMKRRNVNNPIVRGALYKGLEELLRERGDL